MTSRKIHGMAPGLLLLAISISLSTGCAARSADREEIPTSSRDQYASQLDALDERMARLEELDARGEARTAALLQRRAEVERRLEELDRDAPTFAADRQLLEDDLFQLETDVATLQSELQRPVRTARAERPVIGRTLPAATGG
jgi:chromosome segregation ATPase